jgi:YggT family protein
MMNMTSMGITLTNSLLSLYLVIVVIRGILQGSRADFYNPISQLVARVTNPPLTVLRKVLPFGQRIDISIVLLALIVQFAAIELALLAGGVVLADPVRVGLWSVIGVLGLIVNIYLYALIGSIIVSWVAPGSSQPAVRLLYQVTEPIMAPVRSVIPALGGLDFSPIVLFIGINLLQSLLLRVAIASGLPARLVIGL